MKSKVTLGVLVSLAITSLVAGCSGDEPVYQVLEGSVRSTLNQQFKGHPAVSSINCTPHAADVSYDQGYVHFTCSVVFSNGTQYSTPATAEARSYQVSGWNFDFQTPGSLDLTSHVPVRPVQTAASRPDTSLFLAQNLSPLAAALEHRFGNQLILQAAIYPGTAQFVIGAKGSARLVTAHSAGTITVGAAVPFDGSRSGIALPQLVPQVIQKLATAVTARGHLNGPLDRFVLSTSLPGQNAGWLMYSLRGKVHDQAYVLGDGFKEILADGQARAL